MVCSLAGIHDSPKPIFATATAEVVDPLAEDHQAWDPELIQPEKEVILVVIKESQEETVFKALAEAAELDKPGHGIAFVHGIEKVAGYFDSTK